MNQNQAVPSTYYGEKAIYLRHGAYEAILLPDIGGNLIAFRDVEKSYRFLREPAQSEMTAFKQIPYVHGIPVCFPPNRYEDGQLKWNGSTYQFPINEPNTNNHLHGFLYNQPWELLYYGSNDHESSVTIQFKCTSDHDIYRYFPHEFTFQLSYRLSDAGLSQQVMIRNDGHAPMPCLLAFHTAIHAPFASNSSKQDMSVTFTLDKRWELNERMLPTGKFQAFTSDEARLRQPAGISPYFAPMDNHYTAMPHNGSNRMELTDHHNQVKLIYDVGTAYKQWMIWNNQCQDSFFCPEPQINLVNAPNIQGDAEVMGLVSLQQGEIWEETSRLYCIELA